MRDHIDIFNTIPQFVKDQYPQFITFINSYFEYLETPDNFLRILETFRSELDIDTASEETIDDYLNELGLFKLSELKDVYIDKKLLIKSLSELNSLAGSEEGFKLFFKVFFNSSCSIKKPNLFVLSDSNYVNKQFIIVTTNQIFNVLPYPTKALSGNYLESTNSTFINNTSIEAISFIVRNGVKFAKLEINRPIRDFYLNESVKLVFNNEIFYENVVKVAGFDIIMGGSGYKTGEKIKLSTRGLATISEVTTGGYTTVSIINGGAHYSIGDLINVTGTGRSFQAMVSSVDYSGKILDVEILSSGYGYDTAVVENSNIRIKTRNFSTASGAVLRISSTQIGAIKEITIIEDFIDYNSNSLITIETARGVNASLVLKELTNYQNKKYFLNNSNTLGNGYTIQDSKTHFHNNSYIIQSEVSKNYSEKLITEYLHPVGLDRFYKMEIDTL